MTKQTAETPSHQAKQRKKDDVPKAITFFERMARINKADWGTRAKIKVYRVEPVIDQLRVSPTKYIRVFEEPINEEIIKHDAACGSGRYRLYLNFKAPAADEKEIDSVEIEILDQNFPPKISKGAWLDDPRNAKWAWAKKHYDQADKIGQVDGTGFLQGLEVLDRLDDRARERYGNHSDPVDTVEKIINVAKQIAPQPAAPQTENKTLDSIVQLMIGQMRTQADQNNMLLQSLLNQKNNPPAQSEKTSIKEVVALVKDEIIPLVEKLKPGEMIDGITRRSKMSGWQEMLQPAIPVLVDFMKPFAAGLATNLFARTGQPAMPPVNGMPSAQPYGAQSPALPQAPQTAQPQNGAMPPFLNMIAPALLNYMRVAADPTELGEDFASWVNEGFSADPRFKTAIAMARAAGPNVIIAQFKGSPWWMDKGTQNDQPSLAEMEGKFGIFTQAFLNWQPPAMVEEEEDDGPEVIDLG